jgi:hypothetical protein
VRLDLLSTVVAFIAVLLAWGEALLQLTLEEMTQKPEESLTIDLGQIRPPADGPPGIGRGGTVLSERLDIGHHLPHAVKLGPAAGAQPR